MTNFDSAQWAAEFFEVASRTVERNGSLEPHLILIAPETRGIGYFPIPKDLAEHPPLLEKIRAELAKKPELRAVALVSVFNDPRPGDPGELIVIAIETASTRQQFAARVVQLEERIAVGPLNEIAPIDGLPLSGFFEAPAR